MPAIEKAPPERRQVSFQRASQSFCLPARLRCAGIRIAVLRRLRCGLTGRVVLSDILIGARLLCAGAALTRCGRDEWANRGASAASAHAAWTATAKTSSDFEQQLLQDRLFEIIEAD
jgi:hypothetical protein